MTIKQQTDTHKRPEALTRMEKGVYALGANIVIRQSEGKWAVEGIDDVEPSVAGSRRSTTW
jgi:hypothetical protein